MSKCFLSNHQTHVIVKLIQCVQ